MMTDLIINKLTTLSYDNVKEVLKRAENLLKQQKEPNFIFDLSIIEYIDSAGVAMLVELRKLAQNRYNKSIQIKVSPVVKKMLKFYEVENLLDVCNEC